MISPRRVALLGIGAPLSALMLAVLGLLPSVAADVQYPLAGQQQTYPAFGVQGQPLSGQSQAWPVVAVMQWPIQGESQAQPLAGASQAAPIQSQQAYPLQSQQTYPLG